MTRATPGKEEQGVRTMGPKRQTFSIGYFLIALIALVLLATSQQYRNKGYCLATATRTC